jgi:hypothetical protein
MHAPLVERWTVALSVAENAIAAAVRARVFTAHDATEARRLLEEHARWFATVARASR